MPPQDLRDGEIDPSWLALSRLRRGRFQQAIDGCNDILAQNPRDQAVWALKTRAMVR